MSEEEKMKIAVDLAKQGIDLEEVERIGCYVGIDKKNNQRVV